MSVVLTGPAPEEGQDNGIRYIDDDDPPAMPSLDLALARIEAENPAAAKAARAFLEGTETMSVRVQLRVSVAEHAQITETAKALGYGSVSEFLRARALA